MAWDSGLELGGDYGDAVGTSCPDSFLFLEFVCPDKFQKQAPVITPQLQTGIPRRRLDLGRNFIIHLGRSGAKPRKRRSLFLDSSVPTS